MPLFKINFHNENDERLQSAGRNIKFGSGKGLLKIIKFMLILGQASLSQS